MLRGSSHPMHATDPPATPHAGLPAVPGQIDTATAALASDDVARYRYLADSVWSPRREWAALASGSALMALFPLGRFCGGGLVRRSDPARLARGLTLIFPGIEARSFLNINVLLGLLDAGYPGAVEVVDWTTGLSPLMLYHLRRESRNRQVAASLAQRIIHYQTEYPGRPVTLVGHSGGGSFALFVAEALPAGMSVDMVILLNPAISPAYRLDAARARIRGELINFYSHGDWLLVGLGTAVFGTSDGRYSAAAGCRGFRDEVMQPAPGLAPVTQRPYDFTMSRSGHWGGHFGCVHRVFVRRYVAPLVPYVD